MDPFWTTDGGDLLKAIFVLEAESGIVPCCHGIPPFEIRVHIEQEACLGVLVNQGS